MSVAARVNHGRWIVDCPSCPNAHLLPAEGRAFVCAECGSGPHDVEIPHDRDDIDAALAVRNDVNRNWSPGETVDDLLAENTEHGVG